MTPIMTFDSKLVLENLDKRIRSAIHRREAWIEESFTNKNGFAYIADSTAKLVARDIARLYRRRSRIAKALGIGLR